MSLRTGRYSIFQCARRSLRIQRREQVSEPLRPRKKTSVNVHEDSSVCTKDSPASPNRRLTDERKVAAQDEAEDASGNVEEEELEGTHLTFHYGTGETLGKDVEEEVDESGVQENGQHEAEALVGLGGRVESSPATNCAHGAYGADALAPSVCRRT